MYRYYQTSEKSVWSIISDCDTVLDKVREAQGTKATILALSDEINDDTELSSVKYKGPFYADVDCKEDLGQAARSTKKLIDNLIDRDLDKDQIQIFASGSKGFHVLVHEKNFSSGRPVKSLPRIYKEMGLALYVEGLDMQVYSAGRGNCWRLENVQRYDGNYRVRISYKELENVTEAGKKAYDILVSKPRDTVQPNPPKEKCHNLEALFGKCRTAAGKEPKVPEPIDSQKLRTTFKDELPQCMVDLREGKIRKGVNFNQAVLSVSTYVARSGMDSTDRDSLISRMSETCESGSYDSPRSRYEHLLGMCSYMATKRNYEFSCAATRSKLGTKPCDDCALYKEDGNDSIAQEDIGIAVSNNSYYRLGKTENTRISTFHITNPVKIKGFHEENPHVLVTKGIKVDVVTTTGEVHSRVIGEGVWKSKSSFLTILEGVEGAIFLGTDLDVQRIKFMVFDSEEEIEEVKEVDAAGMHIDYISRVPVPVYVENGFSVNKYGVVNSHTLTREVPTPPHLVNVSTEDDRVAGAIEALQLLLKINEPKVVVPLLGWFSACHLKAHIFETHRQFPLVNMWGNAGAGKTKTSELFMWLSGAGSKHDSLSLSLPHTTKFPLINYTTSTTTIPRVLEEFNKARLSRSNYDYYHELMKSSFSHHGVSRGALGSNSIAGKVNAKTVSMPITSPILFISEQPINSTPLIQRSISVSMNSKGRKNGAKAFRELEPIQENLESLAKMMAMTALKTSVKEANDLVNTVDMSKYTGMEERPKLALQIVVAGLVFLTKVLERYQVKVVDLDSLIENYINSFDQLAREVTETTSVTEVDQVLEDMALMAYLNGSTNIDGLEKGKHFYILEDRLIIDMPVAHAMYKRYKRNDSGELTIDSMSQLTKLIRTESYFIADNSICDITGSTRKMMELSLPKMREKGLQIDLFIDS